MTKKSMDNGIQENLTQKALVDIKKMLFHNEIVAGQKLPFRDLAEKLDMSATPVIQALQFLEFQGLIYRKHNKGYYIKQLSLDEVNESYKFRELLEVSLVHESIARLDKTGKAMLTGAYEAYLESLKGIFINEKLIKDMEFHMALASLSDQQIMIKALKNTFEILHLKYGTSLQYVTIEQSDSRDHGRIFDAVMKKDGKLAARYLSDHILHSKKHAVLNLSRMVEEKEGFSI